MTLSIRVAAPMPSRPCRFSLGLQDDSVFVDFDEDAGRLFVRRISFDGFGCCHATEDIGRMSTDHSRTLLRAVLAEEVGSPEVETILRTYFRQNAGALWSDALSTHALL